MLAYWTHSLDPFVVRFPSHWAIAGIRWYGVAYLLGFLFAGLFLNCLSKTHRINLNRKQCENFLSTLFIGILLGGRLGYVCFYQFDYYLQHPMSIFAIWEGGMSAHGAFVGIMLALWIFAKRNQLSFYSLADLTVPLGTFGIILGRCANFINGEIYGTFSEQPWAVLFPGELLARHPSQLYEAIGEGLLLFIWSCFCIFKTKQAIKTPGLLGCKFLILYSCIRFLLEFFREPDAPNIGFLSRGQFYSVTTFILGFLLYAHAKKNTVRSSLFL